MSPADPLHVVRPLGMIQWAGQPHEIQAETLRLVPYAWVKRHMVLPVHEEGEEVWVAMANPLRSGSLEELFILLKRPLKPVLCPEDLLAKLIEACFRPGMSAASQLAEHAHGHQDSQPDEEVDLFDQKEDSPVIRLLNAILAEAIQQEASDLHLEPTEKGLRIRFRIDGVLQERHTPPRELVGPLVTRLKVMARLDIAEHRLPQDGRLRVRIGGRETDFRVSTIPCLGGERLVLRILDKSHVQLGLSHLHMPETVELGFRRCLARAEGLVLVTGPTGSGKTTTLYSAVKEILSHERNLMTIEDPIEVRLPGIAQIQVQPKIGFSFATGLRHILRQDPDVILVGEIRDEETAQIAIQAALTGHLVLSTLHTNDAPSAIARLVEMGIEPYLVGSALLGVLAQRLVRRICPECREPMIPSVAQLKEWTMPLLARAYWGRGCPQCQQSGYAGRLGVYEWMSMSPALQGLVLQTQDSASLKRHAVQEGLKPLRTHGLQLVDGGLTTASEIARVTAPEAEWTQQVVDE